MPRWAKRVQQRQASSRRQHSQDALGRATGAVSLDGHGGHAASWSGCQGETPRLRAGQQGRGRASRGGEACELARRPRGRVVLDCGRARASSSEAAPTSSALGSRGVLGSAGRMYFLILEGAGCDASPSLGSRMASPCLCCATAVGLELVNSNEELEWRARSRREPVQLALRFAAAHIITMAWSCRSRGVHRALRRRRAAALGVAVNVLVLSAIIAKFQSPPPTWCGPPAGSSAIATGSDRAVSRGTCGAISCFRTRSPRRRCGGTSRKRARRIPDATSSRWLARRRFRGPHGGARHRREQPAVRSLEGRNARGSARGG